VILSGSNPGYNPLRREVPAYPTMQLPGSFLEGLLLHAVVPGEAALQGAEPVVCPVRLGDGRDGVGAHANPDNVTLGELLALLAVEADPGRAARISRNLQVQLCVVGQDHRPAEVKNAIQNIHS
jgi:hypothetical protein